MKTRTTILSLAAFATLSLSALAPTQASAWGMREGYGFGYRSMGYVGSSEPCDPCPNEYAPVIRRHHHRHFIEELPCEEEAFQTRGYESSGYETRGYQTRGFENRGYRREQMLNGGMRQAQGYGQGYGRGSSQLQPTQGYAPPQHHLEPHGQSGRRDSEDSREMEAPQQEQPANSAAALPEYSSKELQR